MFNTAARVAAGAALLDTLMPGWDRKVDPGSLDVMEYTKCILAQACGGYGTGLKLLKLNTTKAVQHGFHSVVSERSPPLFVSCLSIGHGRPQTPFGSVGRLFYYLLPHYCNSNIFHRAEHQSDYQLLKSALKLTTLSLLRISLSISF